MQSGSYTANLLGNIRSHLAGLQGYDVMALELIQNADDARAEEISFKITEEGLYIYNSGRFTYCGDLNFRPCKHSSSAGSTCDYHRIVDVGSGGKLSQEENIGRFGIGFVSAYQITDHPEIKSANVRLVLYPESSEWKIETIDRPNGTEFFLPWASDAQSKTRKQLGISHIEQSHIDQLRLDLEKVVRTSLLFLRNLRRATVYYADQLLFACDIDRSAGSDVLVSFRPSGETEYWHIIRAEAADKAIQLKEKYPRLQSLKRDTRVSIAIRAEPQSPEDGLIFAFLPTEQSSGMPLHINADFFPESDRKAVIFSGHQHEQAWNEMLIDTAASALARDPEVLLSMLGHEQFWHLVSRSAELSKSQSHPKCFSGFWEHFQITVPQRRVATAHDLTVWQPKDVFLPPNPMSGAELGAVTALGGRIALEQLRPFRNAMSQLGAPLLNMDRLVKLVSLNTERKVPGETKVDDKEVTDFYLPLWELVQDIIPENEPPDSANTKKLKSLPFILSEDNYLVTIDQTYQAAAPISPSNAAIILPRLAIASNKLAHYPKIHRLLSRLSLRDVVSHIEASVATEPVGQLVSTDRDVLKGFYLLLVDLDRQEPAEEGLYRRLRSLPIWLSQKGLINADQALLPGNFIDPTGFVDLLDTSVLNAATREFVSQKLGIRSQTIEEFVKSVLPIFLLPTGPVNEQKYPRLMLELAGQPSLLNDDGIRQHLANLPIIPTRAGTWTVPGEVYRRTDELAKVLGDRLELWIDTSKIQGSRSINNFIEQLGLRKTPLPKHIVERLIGIAETSAPNEQARRATADAFYTLCDLFDEWKDRRAYRDALEDLKLASCFPAIGDETEWYSPEALYAPYQAEAFDSQAKIIDFRNSVRLKRELLEELDVNINPETKLVVDHLLYCVERDIRPHISTYMVLADRARSNDSQLVRLRDRRCIYVEKTKSFVPSGRLFLSPPNLGSYAFKVPAELESYRPLFAAVGVKESPNAEDYANVLLQISGDHFVKSMAIVDNHRAVYETCLSNLVAIDAVGELPAEVLTQFQEAPSILNMLDHPHHPDELLLRDSEWYAGFFGGEIDQTLCDPAVEFRSLIVKMGVRRLSEVASVSLDLVEGAKQLETEIENTLSDRASIVGRLIHDRPRSVRVKVVSALQQIKAFSFDSVRIQATAKLSIDLITAPSAATQAFYDEGLGELVLARPITRRSWFYALNALLHQLMPEENGGEIAKLTLSVVSLLGMSLEEAEQALSDSGIPVSETASDSATMDLTSPDLSGMGDQEVLVPEQNLQTGPLGERTPKVEAEPSGAIPVIEPATIETATSGNVDRPLLEREKPVEAGLPLKGDTLGRSQTEPAVPTESASEPRTRGKQKEQWDRRLLSYVKMRMESGAENGEATNSREQNLAVEVLARAAVVTFEKDRGRQVEQMPQTHPGYDLISRNPKDDETRYIEVKSISGQWNQTGVGLSRLQFSNAQDFGDDYWLYVVEYAVDAANRRVFPIQNPAKQITSFMFDGNWRDAAAEEPVDPSARYVAGVRLDVQHHGKGTLEEIDARGIPRLLMIKFDSGRKHQLPFNVKTMHIIEVDDDP